jgi:hypothetical protein
MTLTRQTSRQSEQRLRARIRRAFSVVESGRQTLTVPSVEEQVLALIREYCSAPEAMKERVYQRGEKRILRTFRSHRNGRASAP